LQAAATFPLISIITAVHNGAPHLAKAMLSVFAQSYPNVEYIVIDGGSTDGTLEIIDKYKDRLAWFVSEKDSGIAEAWNKGIAAAKGEIIGILNADDWYEKDALQQVAEHFQEADIVYGKLRYWKEGEETYTVSARHELLKNEMSLSHPAVFVRRSLYESRGNFNTSFRYAMDYEFLLRCYIAGCRFRYTGSVLANMSAGGLSDRQWLQGIREVRKAKNAYIGNRFLNYLWFMKQTGSIFLSRTLTKLGLERIVRMYRKFSAVPKMKS
jgi:glycosyltransferase involved in cell wall biosynthesis